MGLRFLQVESTIEGQAVILTLTGELGSLSSADLQDAYAQVEQKDVQALVLDFGGVEYANSAGLAAVIQLIANAGAKGLRLCACGLTPHFKKIFEIMCLTDYITLYDSRAAALAGCSSPDGENQ
jgi:anti-sigma B factor antagonist